MNGGTAHAAHRWLLILGICSIGVLSAVFEMLGMTVAEFGYASRFLAAICICAVAYTHTWKWFLVGLAVVMVLLMIRTDVRKSREQKRGTMEQ